MSDVKYMYNQNAKICLEEWKSTQELPETDVRRAVQSIQTKQKAFHSFHIGLLQLHRIQNATSRFTGVLEHIGNTVGALVSYIIHRTIKVVNLNHKINRRIDILLITLVK